MHVFLRCRSINHSKVKNTEIKNVKPDLKKKN